ncbi:MAG: hypothetical protein JWN76_2852 [Chitinophagaceae bacterium]|nr:hypothetical protein [Chitinophagaceae bacterium]
MKTLATINWIFIIVYSGYLFLLLLERKADDAGEKQLKTAFIISISVIICVMTVFNVLPYKSLKIISLILACAPVIMVLYFIFR